MVYPTFSRMNQNVSTKVKKLWSDYAPPPTEAQIEAALRELGQKPVLLVDLDRDAGEPRTRGPERKTKKKRKVVTQNVHVDMSNLE
ncbi:hypothetical protein GEMRC1_005963 [Eukaryota sp. GEM-RC1]